MRYIITGFSKGIKYQEQYYCRKPSGIKNWFKTIEQRLNVIKTRYKGFTVITEEDYKSLPKKKFGARNG